jgi:hypothetical protein
MQRRDRRVDDGLGGGLVGIAHGQKNHIVAGLAAAHPLLVNAPRSGCLARDAVDKRGKTHDSLPMREAPAATAISTYPGRRTSLAAAPIA